MLQVNITENRTKYRESIGEFITAFAQVELYITMFDAIIQTKNTTNVPLAGSFSIPLKRKLKHINNFIDKLINDNLQKDWESIQGEINDLNLFRNHIIHGTGFSSFWDEFARTMIDEDQKRTTLSFKSLSISDIKALSERTYHVLTGVKGIQGFFLQDFLKATREYFAGLS